MENNETKKMSENTCPMTGGQKCSACGCDKNKSSMGGCSKLCDSMKKCVVAKVVIILVFVFLVGLILGKHLGDDDRYHKRGGWDKQHNKGMYMKRGCPCGHHDTPDKYGCRECALYDRNDPASEATDPSALGEIIEIQY